MDVLVHPSDTTLMEEIRDCTQSPQDAILVSVKLVAAILLHYNDMNNGRSPEVVEGETTTVFAGVLRKMKSDFDFRTRIVDSLSTGFKERLLAERNLTCVTCHARRPALNALLSASFSFNDCSETNLSSMPYAVKPSVTCT